MSVHSFRLFEGLGRDWLQPKPPSRRRGHLIVTKDSFRMKLQKLRAVTSNAVSCIYSYIRKRGVYSFHRRKGSAIYFELMSNCLLAHRELFSLASGRQRDQGLSGESRGRWLTELLKASHFRATFLLCLPALHMWPLCSRGRQSYVGATLMTWATFVPAGSQGTATALGRLGSMAVMWARRSCSSPFSQGPKVSSQPCVWSPRLP